MVNIKSKLMWHSTRFISLSLILCIIISGFSACKSQHALTNKNDLSLSLQELSSENIDSYNNYIGNYKKNETTSGLNISLIKSSITICEGDDLPLTFNVQKSGLYRLRATFAGGGKNLSEYTASLLLNGSLPFDESGQLYFPKEWVIDGEYSYDSQPSLKENIEYNSYAYSNKSYVSEELYWNLQSGENTMVFTADNQAIQLLSLEWEGYTPLKSNLETPSDCNAESIVIQAENPSLRSDPSILEQMDRISAATIPVCENASTYNTFGGDSWKSLGQNATWSFNVEVDGWYCLNMRCRQDYTAGTVSCRRILLDGQPIAEDAQEITVPYSSGFKNITFLNNNDDTVWTYLTAGEHMLTLGCSLGELEPALCLVQQCVSELNRIYRRIIMITGTDPDDYRDYHLSEKLPDVFEDMEQQKKYLEQVVSYLISISNKGESDTSAFEKIIRQLNIFLKNADEIPNQINTFNSNISALGTWLLERSSQPLEIDWLEWQPYGSKAVKNNVSWWKQVKHDINRIYRSYVEDYDTLGESTTEDSISVWVVSGRDQAQIIQDQSQEFSNETNVLVNVKLVTADSIMPATVAGIGPDVTLFNSSANVLGYAIRGALTDLSKLDGFDNAASDFYESAITPYRFNGGVWALPETQSFPMLFYRKDILNELGINIPQTWDDVYDCITTLQKNNMTFGCAGYDVFLYQNSGAYYTDDGASSLMNSEKSVTAFRQWTKFYTNFNLPLSFNFVNRFRTGEMPLAIVDYNNFNSLVVFAPEIKDSWGMTLVPGTKKDDGSIDRSVNSGGTAAMILNNCRNQEAAWNYLKWWVSGNTQSQYARTLETNLGASARVMVASKSAFENQMWTKNEMDLLKNQWKWTVGTPEVAGGYLVGRHINNAFRKIVYQDADIRETLNDYTKIIDKELTLKREEYGLNGGK